jgi:hypothetical protein
MFRTETFCGLLLRNIKDDTTISFFVILFYNSLYGNENAQKISDIITTLEEESMPIVPPKGVKTMFDYQKIVQEMSQRLSLEFFTKKTQETTSVFWETSSAELRNFEFDNLFNLPRGAYQELVKDIFAYALM